MIVEFRTIAARLQAQKRLDFPIGCIVRVGDNYGIASAEDGCPPDMTCGEQWEQEVAR